MTLENATVLYKHFIEIGRDNKAEELLLRYPSLKEKPAEVKTDGKK